MVTIELALKRALVLRRGKEALSGEATEREGMRAELSQELRELTQLIGNVEGKLNLSSDPDVIEAFIFELSALQTRRRSVLRKAKEMGL